MARTYTPVQRLLYPRHGIVVHDGVGRRTSWYRNRRTRDAVMARVAELARREADQ